MEIYLTKNSASIGPFGLDEVRQRVAEGWVLRTDLAWYEGCTQWIPLGTIPGLFPTPPPVPSATFPNLPSFPNISGFPSGRIDFAAGGTDSEEVFLKRVSDYERISGILWLCLAAIQIISLVGIVAGVWNVFAAMSRFSASKRILRRDRLIPKDYEGVTQLIIIAAVNFFFGGVIGVVFVAFDFYIRDLILKNAHIFNQPVEGEIGLSTNPADPSEPTSEMETEQPASSNRV